MLSLVLTIVFSILIVLGVGFFHIMSTIVGSNIAVLGIGFAILFLVNYIAVSNMDGEFDSLSKIDSDSEEIV
jgi:hypothetical protein